MEQKFYLVIYDCVYDSIGEPIRTKLFPSIDSAKKYMSEQVNDFKEYITDNWLVEEYDWSYEAWKDGYYLDFHVYIQIREIEIERL